MARRSSAGWPGSP